jgi:hypothetical protein
MLFAACSSPEDEPMAERLDAGSGMGGGSDTISLQDLQQLLDRRAEAQMQGDEDGYLADLDPSNTRLIEREQMVFANLQQFATDDVRFVLGRHVSEPLPGQGAENVRFAPVIKVVKLTADAASDGVLGPGESFEYVMARRDGAWVVADIVPLDGAELASREGRTRGPGDPSLGQDVVPANAPWNLTPLQVLNVGNVWLAADDSVDLERYADVAEAEAQRVEALWGDRPRFPGHVLFFTRRKKAMRTWFDHGRAEISGFREGFAEPAWGVGGDGQTSGGQYAGGRMVIFVPGVEAHGGGPRQTMRHELTHTATMRAWGTGDGVLYPRPASWAVEGFARFIELRDEPDLEQRNRAEAVRGFTGSLPLTQGFQEGDDVGANYSVSSTVFSFIEQIADLETAIDFYEEVVKHPDDLLDTGSAFADTPEFGRVCQEVIGMDKPEFLEQWAAFVRAGA